MISDLFLEGLGAAAEPCAWIFVVSGLAVLLLARQESTPATIGYVPAAIGVTWLRFSVPWERPTSGLLALGLMAAVVALVVPVVRRVDLVAMAGGALTGGVCAFLWVPCGGPQLALLASELTERRLAGLGLLAAFFLGMLAPLVGVAVVLQLLPNGILFPIRPAMVVIGGLILVGLAVVVAAEQGDALVQWLLARSSQP